MKHLSVFVFVILFIHVNVALAENIYGTVSFARTGQPVAHALVKFILNDEVVARTFTGDDGKYFIRNISEETYTVIIIYEEVPTEFPNTVVGPSGGRIDFEIESIYSVRVWWCRYVRPSRTLYVIL